MCSSERFLERKGFVMGVLIWFGCCAGVAYYASCRGRSWLLWGLLAVFISPLIAAIVLAILRDKSVDANIAELRMGQQQMHDRISADEQMTAQRMQQMEHALLSHEAHHAQIAQQQASQAPAHQAQQIASRPRFCANCGGQLEPGDTFCAQCGAKVE